MKKRLALMLSTALVLTGAVSGLLISPVFSRHVETTTHQAESPARLEREFQEAWLIAKRHYAGEVDIVRVTESAIRGMLRSLDPHSNYLDPKDYAEMRREQESQFYGVGVTISQRNGRVHVLSVIPGGSAARAGIRYGDAIIEVDGKSAVGWNTTQVAKHVRGERNTYVDITLERVGEPEPLSFRIKRAPVPLPSVDQVAMLRPGVGYIGLTRGFQGTTINELNDAINELKRQRLQGLILDLRNNPGGLLSQAVQVADRFLKPGEEIVSVQGRRRSRPAYKAVSRSADEFPMVVLINRASASASEIVAGALQDHDRALIVGEPSFGKGLVQTVFPILGGAGGAITLSTARYYTPSGRLIQRDYSRLSTYDYYMRRENHEHGQAATTDAGRPVYGGDGIEPDVLIPTPHVPERNRIFHAAFEFSRHLVAGLIPGLESFRVHRPKESYTDEDLDVTIDGRVLGAFRRFLQERREFQLSSHDVETHIEYARQRIQSEVLSARYGVEAGNRAALNHDEQLQRAIDTLPRAKELVENLRLSNNKRF